MSYPHKYPYITFQKFLTDSLWNQNCKTIFGSVFQDNPASSRVLTNAGFEYIGEAESFSVARSAMVTTWTYIKKLD